MTTETRKPERGNTIILRQKLPLLCIFLFFLSQSRIRAPQSRGPQQPRVKSQASSEHAQCKVLFFYLLRLFAKLWQQARACVGAGGPEFIPPEFKDSFSYFFGVGIEFGELGQTNIWQKKKQRTDSLVFFKKDIALKMAK